VKITANDFLCGARAAVILGALLVLGLPKSAKADTVYTYTGGTDNYCFGTYASSGTACAGAYAIAMTFDLSETGINLNHGLVNPYLTSFSVSDGAGLFVTNLTGDGNFYLSTDSSGAVTGWDIVVESDSSDPYYSLGMGSIVQYDIPNSYSYGYSKTNTGRNLESGLYATTGLGSSSTLGTWKETTSAGTGVFTITPEPSTGVLVLAGVGLVLGLRKRIVQYLPDVALASRRV